MRCTGIVLTLNVKKNDCPGWKHSFTGVLLNIDERGGKQRRSLRCENADRAIGLLDQRRVSLIDLIRFAGRIALAEVSGSIRCRDAHLGCNGRSQEKLKRDEIGGCNRNRSPHPKPLFRLVEQASPQNAGGTLSAGHGCGKRIRAHGRVICQVSRLLYPDIDVPDISRIFTDRAIR